MSYQLSSRYDMLCHWWLVPSKSTIGSYWSFCFTSCLVNTLLILSSRHHVPGASCPKHESVRTWRHYLCLRLSFSSLPNLDEMDVVVSRLSHFRGHLLAPFGLLHRMSSQWISTSLQQNSCLMCIGGKHNLSDTIAKLPFGTCQIPSMICRTQSWPSRAILVGDTPEGGHSNVFSYIQPEPL